MKNTKRALLLSALAIVMSVAMLIGSTFAWFTDSASTAVNTIQSGTLKVELEMLVDEANDVWETAEGKTLAWKKAAGAPADEAVLWEPGCTYELPKLRVRNAGSLALKYQIVVTGFKGDAKLLEAIDFVLPTATNNYKGLAAGASDEFVIKGTMDKDAGNEYQGLTIDDIAITVYATQLEAEYDSLNNTYDAMATVDTEEELLAAIAGDYDAIALGGNIVLTNGIVIPAGKTLTIDLMGFSISQVVAPTASYELINNKGNLTIQDTAGAGKIALTDTSAGDPTFGWGSYTIRNEGTLVVNGGTVANLSEHNANGSVKHMYCAIFQYSGSTTINGGTVSTPSYRSVRLWKGDMTINGGNFEGQVWVQAVDNTSKLTINGGNFAPRGVDGSSVYITNDQYPVELSVTGGNFATRLGSKVVIPNSVTGGTFGADPTPYVAAGYDVAKVDENTWFVGEGTVVTNKTELQTALTNAVDGDVINLATDIEGKLTLIQNPDTKIVVNGNGNTFKGSVIVNGQSAAHATTGVVFENIRFVAENKNALEGEACIMLGKSGDTNTRYASNVTIKDCYFDINDNTIKAIESYTGGDKNITITNCTVTSRMHSFVQVKNVNGLVIDNCKIYSKNGINLNSSSNVEVKNCEFKTSGYCVRAGVSGGTSGKVTLTKNYLESQNDDGDATIIVRGTALQQIELVVTGNTIKGTPAITTGITNYTESNNTWN